jgi:hypothetical protein
MIDLARIKETAAQFAGRFERWIGSSRDPFADNIHPEVNVELTVRDEDGNVKQVVRAHNLVTTVGKEKLAEQLVASPATEKPKYIGVGKSGTAAAIGDTALGEEVKRKEATTRTASGKVLTMAVVYAAGEATGTIKEAGIFAASTVGSMYARLVFEGLAIAAGDSLEVKWTLTYE